MNRYIFDKPFERVFTQERLRYEIGRLEIDERQKAELLEQLAAGDFFEKAAKASFSLPKGDGTYRTIALSSPKTKLLQRILADELSAVLRFSDASYAFRKGKSPFKAIMRVKDYLRRYGHVAKADIEHFFDSIDQTIPMKKLQRLIADRRILSLIGYHISQGYMKKNRWHDRSEGVFQGDVLSPLLSNIYLDAFDRHLEELGIAFVRYSDDLLFLGEDRQAVSKARRIASDYLQHLKLRFNPKKTYLSTIDEGFEYLGIFFRGETMRIDAKRLEKKIATMKEATRRLDLARSVEKMNETTRGWRNYYDRIVTDEIDAARLQEALETLMANKVAEAKRTGEISGKKEAMARLADLRPFLSAPKSHWIESIVKSGFERAAAQKPMEAAKRRVADLKREARKRELLQSELVVAEAGLFLGFSRGKVQLKRKGRVELEAPIGKIERILVLNRYTTVSAYLLHECAKRKIDIDFIERQEPYAQMVYYRSVLPELHLAQLKHYFSPRGFAIARAITQAKSRNQINLLQYFNRRRHDEKVAGHIAEMEKTIEKIWHAKEKKELMGLEGSIATHYWDAFGRIVGQTGFIRHHQGAADAINQALNYGYAILYHRVQSALLHLGFDLHYPLYHAFQANKPTLVFDMVEEFRQPVVDREIAALLAKGWRIEQSTDSRLAKESIKRLVQKIQVRLATPTKSRYGKTPIHEIITNQAQLLRRTLTSEAHYKSYVARF